MDGLLGTWHTRCLVTPLFTAACYDVFIPLIFSSLCGCFCCFCFICCLLLVCVVSFWGLVLFPSFAFSALARSFHRGCAIERIVHSTAASYIGKSKESAKVKSGVRFGGWFVFFCTSVERHHTALALRAQEACYGISFALQQLAQRVNTCITGESYRGVEQKKLTFDASRS